MTITIDISPQAEANLARLAKQQGIDPAMLVGKVLEERFASVTEASPANSDVPSAPALDPKAAAAISWLNQRIAEDATDDPEEIREADEEVAELKRNLNANRAATGERLVSR